MIIVSHNPHFLDYGWRPAPALSDCTVVASVDTLDLDRAYVATQNMDCTWLENRGVNPTPEVLAAQGCRSTSVGDLLIRYNKDGTVEEFVVESVGFVPLSQARSKPLAITDKKCAVCSTPLNSDEAEDGCCNSCMHPDPGGLGGLEDPYAGLLTNPY